MRAVVFRRSVVIHILIIALLGHCGSDRSSFFTQAVSSSSVPCYGRGSNGRIRRKAHVMSRNRCKSIEYSSVKEDSFRGGGFSKSPPSVLTATQTVTSPVKSSAVLNGIKNSVASGLAAVCAKTLLAPFDTIKTIQQHHHTDVASGSLTFLKAANLVTSRPRGFLELYAGLGAAAVGSIPSVGIYFGVYSYCKQTIGSFLSERLGDGQDENKRKMAKTLTIASSAAIGNTVASVARVPYEVLKQSVQTGKYATSLKALGALSRSPDGAFRAFFPLGSISSQMVRDIPYAVFTLLSYEYLRDNWVKRHQERSNKPSLWRDMTAGAAAGGLGSYLTNPMDVIKTRLQTGNLNYDGVLDCAGKIWTEEGPSAFLKGSVPRLMHKIPANAVFFVSYEFFRRLLKVEDANIL